MLRPLSLAVSGLCVLPEVTSTHHCGRTRYIGERVNPPHMRPEHDRHEGKLLLLKDAERMRLAQQKRARKAKRLAAAATVG